MISSGAQVQDISTAAHMKSTVGLHNSGYIKETSTLFRKENSPA